MYDNVSNEGGIQVALTRRGYQFVIFAISLMVFELVIYNAPENPDTLFIAVHVVVSAFAGLAGIIMSTIYIVCEWK